jgi:hypothetical protein
MASAAGPATGPATYDHLGGLPPDAWALCLKHLVPSGEVFKDRGVCRAFSELTLPSIQRYLESQETVSAELFDHLHLPLFYLLIFQNSAFDAEQGQHGQIPETELHDLWRDYSVPQLFSYALGFCTGAKEIDLTGSHYSIHTIIGEPEDFECEVATLDLSTNPTLTTYSQVEPVISGMPEIFQQSHPHPLYLPNVETLKISAPHSPDIWPRLAQIFPNLKNLEIIGGTYSAEEMTAIRGHFQQLEDAEKD